MEKMASDGPKWGRKDFFLLIQTLPTFWSERIRIFRILFFPLFGSQISGFPGPQISKIWPGPGRAWALGRASWAGWALGWAGLGPWAGCAVRVAEVESKVESSKDHMVKLEALQPEPLQHAGCLNES